MIEVCKFGGSSLQSAKSRQSVVDIVKQKNGSKIIIIASAMGRYDESYATQTLASLTNNKITRGEKERLLSIGETISTIVLSSDLNDAGIKAIALSSNQAGLKIKDHYFIGINRVEILEKLKEYDVVVLPGFQGIDPVGEIGILENGDSDYSAVYVATKLGLKKVSIYSDVCGIYTADPKIVDNARLIPRISYYQALDLTAHKARIICHKALVEAAKYKGFVIDLYSTFDCVKGTTISHQPSTVKTMSIDPSFIGFVPLLDLSKEQQKVVFEKIGQLVLIEKENSHLFHSVYEECNEYTKLHFVGEQFDHLNIICDNQTALLPSNIEKNSFYVLNDKTQINRIHDILIGGQ